MTRGKQGVAAARRKAASEVETTTETYQRRVAALTAENKALRERVAEVEAARRQDLRVLKAQRDEGVSPMLDVLREQNQKLTEERDSLRLRLREITHKHERFVIQLIEHFTEVHGMSGREAMESVLNDLAVEEGVKHKVLRHDNTVVRGTPPATEEEAARERDMIVRIEKARGQRR